ncbi:MAG TPA: hypothetical protein VE404_00595, partial [Verrucomicrobiae bacterium]|nr:hypothetical protein [Verrucomicrobiae bacterium]
MRTTAVLTVITLSAWSAGAAADAAPTGFDGAIAEYDALRVGDEAIAVSDLALTSGHLQLVMSRGRAAPVFAGDRRVGLFFEGSGRLEYLSAEPAEYPVMAFNAARGSDVRTEKRGGRMRILDEFRGLLFLSPNGPAIVPGGAPAAALSDAFRKHREKFLRDRGFLLSHQLALWALDVPASRPARAEISGGRDDLVHVFDPAWDGSETLYALERRQSDDPEMRRRLWPTLLSRQAIDRDRGVVAPPHFLLTGVEYTLVASGAKEVTARLRETLLPLDTGVRVLDFDLSSDLYGHPGCRPAKRRSLHLRGASSAAGRPLAVDHRDDEVLVDLGAAPPAGTPVEIQFEIDGDFLIHPNQDEFWDLGSEAWFPQPGLSARAYSLHATVKAKKPYVPFASGETVFRGEEGEYNVVETKLEKPTAFTAVVAGKYRFQETSRGGLTIRVASYGGRDPESWDRLTNLAYAAVGFYQSFL